MLCYVVLCCVGQYFCERHCASSLFYLTAYCFFLLCESFFSLCFFVRFIEFLTVCLLFTDHRNWYQAVLVLNFWMKNYHLSYLRAYTRTHARTHARCCFFIAGGQTLESSHYDWFQLNGSLLIQLNVSFHSCGWLIFLCVSKCILRVIKCILKCLILIVWIDF